jgi:integrase
MQSLDEIDRLIRAAIVEKIPVRAVYDGRSRVLCPYMLGRNKEGRVQKKADGTPKRCFPHMFRDTFAVEMLLAGVPLEQVSMLLVHKSVKITEKHYARWVKARQEQLEQNVRKAWGSKVTTIREGRERKAG